MRSRYSGPIEPPRSGRPSFCSASRSATTFFATLSRSSQIGVAHRLEYLGETWAPPALLRREIGPAPKGLAVGRQEHGQGPAALFAHQRKRVLVDRVEVGPLLAIHFDVDEQLVHLLGDVRIFKALMRHDVAPMACGVADGEHDRLAGGLGGGECRIAPCLPMNRVVLVLEEVGARFLAETVAVHCGSCHADSRGRGSADAFALRAATG